MSTGTGAAVAVLAGHSTRGILVAFAAVLAAACAAEMTHEAAWYVAAAALLVLGLAIGGRHWMRRASGKVAVVVAGAVLIIGGLLAADPVKIATAAAPMSSAIVLMLSIALIRPIFSDHRLDTALAALLLRVPACLRPLAIVLATCGCALGLSFGAVGVFGATLKRRAAPASLAACLIMQGLVLSMLLGPSTASVAAVMATYPGVSWGASLTIGLPLLAAGVIVATVLGRPLVIELGEAQRRGALPAAIAVLLAELATAILAHAALGLSMTLAISLASTLVALGCIAIWGRRDFVAALARADERMHESWHSMMAESALFLACGLVVGLMQTTDLAETAKSLAMVVLPSGFAGIAALLLAMPLLSVIGIHPMVPFAVLSPVIPAAVLGISETGLYAIWIAGFMLSMLVSPVSVLTMVAGITFDLPGHLLGVRGNGLYAAVFAIAGAILIALCCAA